MQFINFILKRLNLSHLFMAIILFLCFYIIYDLNNEERYSFIKSVETSLETLEEPSISFNEKNEETIITFKLPKITDTNTYLLFETPRDKDSGITLLINDVEIEHIYPFKVDIKDSSGYNFYHLYAEQSSGNAVISTNLPVNYFEYYNDIITIGTLENIIMKYASKSFTNLVFSVILFIMCIAILIVFYIAKMENYSSVQFFAGLSLAISIHLIISAPFSSLLLSNLSDVFDYYGTYVYILTTALTIFMMLFINTSKFHDKILKVLLLLSSILLISSIIMISLNHRLVDYFVINHSILRLSLSIYGICLIIYNITKTKKIETIIGSFAIICFAIICSMGYNKRLYAYQTHYFNNMFFTLIAFYIISVCLYITILFINRRLNMKKIEDSLIAERVALNNLHLSGLNNLTYTEITWLCAKIGSQTLQILSQYNYCFIAFEPHNDKPTNYFNKGKSNYTTKEIYAIIKENFSHTVPLHYKDIFEFNKGYITLTAKNGDSLYIYIDYKYPFTDSEKIIAKILCASILSTFNNSRVYSEISATEKDMLLTIGNIINSRLSSKANCEISGELAFILAKSFGLNDSEANSLRLATYIYNIGTISLSDKLASTTNPNEINSVAHLEHTVIGYEMLSKLDGPTMEMAAICSLEHHEKYDGTGYRKMSKNETSHYTRIVNIVEGFNVYFHEHMDGRDILEVLSESFMFLSTNKQVIYDPYLVDLFIKQKKDIVAILKKFHE